MTVLTTGKRATHRSQRGTGSPTSGSDCGVMVCLMAIDHASRGKVTWSSDKAAVKWIRDVMGKPKGATTIGDAIRVLRSPQLAARFAAQGLQPPPVRDRRGAQWTTIKDDLRDGALVGLAIDRGAWLDAGLPPDASAFRGGHAVGMFGMSSSSPWETQVMDPLLPGWRVLNFPALRKPAGLFGAKPWGEGRAEAYAVGRSKPLVVTPPEPPPPPDPALDRAIEALLVSAQESDDTAAALESQATTLRTRATARRALVETLRGG